MRYIPLILLVFVLAGCPIMPDEEAQRAQWLADNGFGAYESDGKMILYSLSQEENKSEYVVFDLPKGTITYANEYKGADFTITIDENGIPQTVTGHIGTTVIENFGDGKFDFTIFREGDTKAEFETYLNYSPDSRLMSAIENLIEVSSRGISFGSVGKALEYATLLIDATFCGVSVAASFTPALPFVAGAAVRCCTATLISLANIFIDDPEMSLALTAAHNLISPVQSVVTGTMSAIALLTGAHEVMEEHRAEEIEAARKELLGEDDPPEPPEPGDDRFINMGNGTVRDNDTGLIWTRRADIAFGSLGSYTKYHANWWDATNVVSLLSHGEHGITDGSSNGDWRLPTKSEWEDLFDHRFYSPAISSGSGNSKWSEGDVFTGNLPGDYWSSTEVDHDSAWIAWVASGDMVDHALYNTWDNKYSIQRVWPVRDPFPHEIE